MAALTKEQKAYVVQELAMYRTPTEVVDLVKEEFGLTLDRRHVQLYDPTRSGQKPAKEWCDLFAATRAAFNDTRAGLAITQKSWRMRELEDMTRRAKKSKNYKLAAELLEQAAKELGEAYTNHRAKEPAAATEEERIARMRTALEEMDRQTVGHIAPALSVAAGGLA